MEWLVGGIAVLVMVALIATFLTPRHVRYVETIDIDAPAEAIYDHIRLQERLMRWSAWPSETGSACSCEGVDGQIDARTVFFTAKGDRFGHQEVIALDPGRAVVLSLAGKGPPQKPVLTFKLFPISASRTRVELHFDNAITRPFNLILRLAGIVRWTRSMHLKDLAGLKRYAEPPHQTYIGEPAVELQAA